MDLPALANLALQAIGTRTTVTAAELAAQSSNEAIQFNLAATLTRDELLRMAPWECSTGAGNLVYITSLPGTTENQSTPANQNQWTPGLPIPHWTYEYAYPVDCLQAFYIFTPEGEDDDTPYDVVTDKFFSALSAAVTAGGTGHAVGDVITLASGPVTQTPIGAPAQLLVSAVSSGVITAVTVVNVMPGASPGVGGLYFSNKTTLWAQGTTTGLGINATFTLTFGPATNQRVIVTDQQYATLMYSRQITDPNSMDPSFQSAWIHVIAARLCMALTGDKAAANNLIGLANKIIDEARSNDGNEGLTILDITPDWLKIRGCFVGTRTRGTGYIWGNLWPGY